MFYLNEQIIQYQQCITDFQQRIYTHHYAPVVIAVVDAGVLSSNNSLVHRIRVYTMDFTGNNKIIKYSA